MCSMLTAVCVREALAIGTRKQDNVVCVVGRYARRGTGQTTVK